MFSQFLCPQVSHVECVSREEARDFVEDDNTHTWTSVTSCGTRFCAGDSLTGTAFSVCWRLLFVAASGNWGSKTFLPTATTVTLPVLADHGESESVVRRSEWLLILTSPGHYVLPPPLPHLTLNRWGAPFTLPWLCYCFCSSFLNDNEIHWSSKNSLQDLEGWHEKVGRC